MPITVKQPAPRAALRALKQPIFDAVDLGSAVGVPNVTFFQAPIGQQLPISGAVKTIRDTNLGQAGQLGVPQEFDLFGFQVSFYYAAGYYLGTVASAAFCTDFSNVYEAGVFQFFFGLQRPWCQIPLTRIPQGNFAVHGPTAVTSDAVAATTVHNGVADGEEFYKFLANDKQIGINSAENFSARIDYPNGNLQMTATGNLSRLMCFLNGVLYAAL
jgi:hypothetical protein